MLQVVTKGRVRYSGRRRAVTVAARKFSMRAPRTLQVRMRLSRPKYRLVRRLRRVRVTIKVLDRDSAGRRRISERDVVLRAR